MLKSYMGGIERGQRNLSLTNIMRIVTGLEMKPFEFFIYLDATSRSNWCSPESRSEQGCVAASSSLPGSYLHIIHGSSEPQGPAPRLRDRCSRAVLPCIC